jgi:hypothetical protein
MASSSCRGGDAEHRRSDVASVTAGLIVVEVAHQLVECHQRGGRRSSGGSSSLAPVRRRQSAAGTGRARQGCGGPSRGTQPGGPGARVEPACRRVTGPMVDQLDERRVTGLESLSSARAEDPGSSSTTPGWDPSPSSPRGKAATGAFGAQDHVRNPEFTVTGRGGDRHEVARPGGARGLRGLWGQDQRRPGSGVAGVRQSRALLRSDLPSTCPPGAQARDGGAKAVIN